MHDEERGKLLDEATAKLSDELLRRLRVEAHEGSVELLFKIEKGLPHTTRIRRLDSFTRGDLDRDF